MAGQDSNDKIAGLIKQACPPAAASPEFKAKLRQQLSQQAGALGAQASQPLWQQPFVWIPAVAAMVVAAALVVYFVAFTSRQPSVTTSDATNVTTDSATLNGDLTSLGTAENVSVLFEWGTAAGSYDHTTAVEARTSTGVFSEDLSGLTPGTTYYFRAEADGYGSPVYGVEESFATLTTQPSVTTNDATNLTTDSATLNGDLTSLGAAENVTVLFEWGTVAGSYDRTTAVEARTSTGVFSEDLSGLTPGTTYYFRAEADGYGSPVYGEEESFTTSTSPPAATTAGATNVTTTSAVLNGNLASLGTATRVTVSFEWGTGLGSYAHTTADQAMTMTGAFSAGLSGLTPGTTYYYRAKAVGDGTVYGEEKSFTTLTLPPTARTGSATEVHRTSAVLNGVLDSLGTAGNVQVSFQWGTTTAYDNETALQILATQGSFNATLTGLMPNTTYHFRARALGHGSAYGDDLMFTTGPGAPGQKTWYLSADNAGSAMIMYDGDTSSGEGTVQLHAGTRPASQLWLANQSSSGATYQSDNWMIHLALSHITGEHRILVEVGTWDGSSFASYDNCTLVISGENDTTVYDSEVNFQVRSFTVPDQGYVAVRLTVNQRWVDVHVGGSHSYLQSPLYPETTAPTVTTSAATNIARTTATLNGYLGNFGTASSVILYFEVGTTADYVEDIQVESATSGSSFSLDLTDLAPNTMYHFRAKAVGDGINYGVDMTFTTPP